MTPQEDLEKENERCRDGLEAIRQFLPELYQDAAITKGVALMAIDAIVGTSLTSEAELRQAVAGASPQLREILQRGSGRHDPCG